MALLTRAESGSVHRRLHANMSFDTSSLYNSMSSFNVTLVVLYVLIVIVGLLGNTLVIIIVCKTRSMITTTNILLVNVAVADLISLIWCPIPLVVNLLGKHASGVAADYICKFFTGYSVTCVTVMVTYISLVVLAMERYYAIVKPFKQALVSTNKRMYYVVGVIWIMAATSSLPAFIFSEYDEKSGRCLDPWTLEKAGLLKWLFVLTAVFSMFFSSCLFFCYFQILRGIYVKKTVCSAETAASRHSSMKEKRKLTIISMTVTLAYHLCYLPFLTFEMYIAFQSYQSILENYEVLYKVYRIFGFIMYVNSCLNPFFYGFQSSNYRRNFKRIFLMQPQSREVTNLTSR